MGKTIQQRRYEQWLSSKYEHVAHPAVSYDGLQWETRCEWRGCREVFVTPTMQKRYCSSKCKSAQAAYKDRYYRFLLNAYMLTCALQSCGKKFVPSRHKRFCSTACRKRASVYVPPPELRFCPGCGVEITSMRRDARFCSAKCRVRCNRVEKKLGLRTGKDRPPKPRLWEYCAVCQTSMEGKRRDAMFCSVLCKAKWQATPGEDSGRRLTDW